MSNTFPRPSLDSFTDSSSFVNAIVPFQENVAGRPRTTASMSGGTTYGATSFNVSDILQGTFAVKDHTDQLLVLNQAATTDLSNLYSLGADSFSSFGTREVADMSQSNQFTSDGLVNEEWVNSLPKQSSTTKGFIWKSRGLSTMENHLPTDADLEKDKKQHLQYDGLDPARKHPNNMIRSNNGKNANEDPNNVDLPGSRGPFGWMDPVEEQFYMVMPWPQDGAIPDYTKAGLTDIAEKCKGLSKEDYKHQRILVYSTVTKKAVVCTPGDYGPRPYHNNNDGTGNTYIGGMSPDAHYALRDDANPGGTFHGWEIIVGWMPDDTPVGPYTPSSAEAGALNEGTSTSQYNIPSATQLGSNTIAEIKYACSKILNHPNCRMGQERQLTGQHLQYVKGFRALMTTGILYDNPEVLYREGDRAFLYPSLINYLYLILEGGFILDSYLSSFRAKPAGSTSTGENHLLGGAIDIGQIGIASEGVTYWWDGTAKTNWRRVSDKLCNYLSTLSDSSRPNWLAGPYEYTYSNNFKLNIDPNPNHLHIGFTKDRSGALMSALKQSSGGTNEHI